MRRSSLRRGLSLYFSNKNICHSKEHGTNLLALKSCLPSHGLTSIRYDSTKTSREHPFENLQPNRENTL